MDLENGEGEGGGRPGNHSTATYSFSYISWLQLAAEYESCSQ